MKKFLIISLIGYAALTMIHGSGNGSNSRYTYYTTSPITTAYVQHYASSRTTTGYSATTSRTTTSYKAPTTYHHYHSSYDYDDYNAKDYADAEDFYDEWEDDFDDFEDAEDYYDSHQ